MAIKEWESNYPTAVDTSTEMPALVNIIDKTNASQPNALKDAVIALETEVGATVPAAGTLRARIEALEGGPTREDYLSLTNVPTGAPAPTALYQFDGVDILDRSGNGHNLTAVGTPLYGWSHGVKGAVFDNWYVKTANSIAELQTFGALTIEMVMTPFRFDASSDNIYLFFGAPTELEADNLLYTFRAPAPTGAAVTDRAQTTQVIHEYGAGVNEEANFSSSVVFIMEKQHYCVTRDAAGTTYTFYLNGSTVDAQAVANPPTGGTAGALHVGGDGLAYAEATVSSVRISIDTEYTAAQVLEAAQRVRLQ